MLTFQMLTMLLQMCGYEGCYCVFFFLQLYVTLLSVITLKYLAHEVIQEWCRVASVVPAILWCDVSFTVLAISIVNIQFYSSFYFILLCVNTQQILKWKGKTY